MVVLLTTRIKGIFLPLKGTTQVAQSARAPLTRLHVCHIRQHYFQF